MFLFSGSRDEVLGLHKLDDLTFVSRLDLQTRIDEAVETLQSYGKGGHIDVEFMLAYETFLVSVLYLVSVHCQTLVEESDFDEQFDQNLAISTDYMKKMNAVVSGL